LLIIVIGIGKQKQRHVTLDFAQSIQMILILIDSILIYVCIIYQILNIKNSVAYM